MKCFGMKFVIWQLKFSELMHKQFIFSFFGWKEYAKLAEISNSNFEIALVLKYFFVGHFCVAKTQNEFDFV
jgi:hypothetical protein